MAYTHLSLEERYYIEIQRKEGVSLNKIAKALGREQSTISREVARNTGQRGYRHQQAQRFTQKRHQDKEKATKLTDSIKRRIANEIRNDLSPEQVAGRLDREGVITLHHETVYHSYWKTNSLVAHSISTCGIRIKRIGNATVHPTIAQELKIVSILKNAPKRLINACASEILRWIRLLARTIKVRS